MTSQRKNNSANRGAIAGRVTSPQGDPVANATVMITGDSPSHKDIAALTSEHGEYRFDDLIPGDYTIMVNEEVHGTQTKQVFVETGHISRLDFSLPD